LKVVWIRVALALGIMVLAAGVSLIAIKSLRDRTSASASIEQATNDEEWLRLIDEAKAKKDKGAVFSDLQLGPEVAVFTSCKDLPADWTQTQLSVEPSADGSLTRYVFLYSNPAGDATAALILVSGDDVTDCAPKVKDVVTTPDTYNEKVDKHICDEMALMAAGKEKTDKTLRDASPKVAKKYVETFCS